MKKLLKMVKPGDFIIVALLVLLSFVPLAIFTYQNNASANGDNLHVVISADGEVVHEMELKNDHTREIYEFVDDHGHENTIVREGQTVYMADANCTDLLCVQQGEITEAGETIVCLPNRVLVEITSDGESPQQNDDDIDIIS
ncbi:NusG domain II-containing protein [Carnobacteriaceae bacterium 52-44]|jgi:Uncharacterized protein conserved in bacteria